VTFDPYKAETLGARLKLLRASRGESLREVGKVCGVSAGAAHQWEQGVTSPTLKNARTLATHYDVPLDWFSPPKNESKWTCGHVGGAMCAECYRILAWRAHELAEENLRLHQELETARRK